MKLQMVGLSHRSHSRITRENKERGSFTAFHFDKDDKMIAIDTINSPADHMAGRKLMEKGISVSRRTSRRRKHRTEEFAKMKKLGRFNLISLIIAICCAIGFYYAEDTDSSIG